MAVGESAPGPDSPALTVIVPAYNERQSVGPLYRALAEVLGELELAHETIFIDDGSDDGTFDELRSLEGSVRCVQLRRNFGKSIALATGFAMARGDVVITMDADLQDDPREIPRLLEKIDEGWDVVSGWKETRHDPLEKRLMSKIFNGVVSRTSGLKLHDFNCGLKAYRREVVKKLRLYGEHHRFIPVIAASYGYRVTEIPVTHHPREFGHSKYGFGRVFSGLFDFFTITFLMFYGRRPLHFLGTISTVPFGLGWLLILYVLTLWIFSDETGMRPALIAGVFLVGISLQIFIFGLLAELITHVSFRTSFEPDDFVRHVDEGPGGR